jgi:hypothetical protein
MIFVFGNSHAHVFTNTHPATFGMGNKNERFTSLSLGPTIAYNFYEHHYPTMLNWIGQLNIDKDPIIKPNIPNKKLSTLLKLKKK